MASIPKGSKLSAKFIIARIIETSFQVTMNGTPEDFDVQLSDGKIIRVRNTSFDNKNISPIDLCKYPNNKYTCDVRAPAGSIVALRLINKKNISSEHINKNLLGSSPEGVCLVDRIIVLGRKPETLIARYEATKKNCTPIPLNESIMQALDEYMKEADLNIDVNIEKQKSLPLANATPEELLAALAKKGVVVLASKTVADLAEDHEVPIETIRANIDRIRKAVEHSSAGEAIACSIDAMLTLRGLRPEASDDAEEPEEENGDDAPTPFS